jgi:hypothetical protein
MTWLAVWLAKIVMGEPSRDCLKKACTHEDYVEASDGRKLPRLTSRQIKSTLSGFNVIYQSREWGLLNMYPAPRENYYKHGVITVSLDRATFGGKWKVRDNLLCILGTPVDGCRKVYASRDALAVRLSDDGYERVYLGNLARR